MKEKLNTNNRYCKPLKNCSFIFAILFYLESFHTTNVCLSTEHSQLTEHSSYSFNIHKKIHHINLTSPQNSHIPLTAYPICAQRPQYSTVNQNFNFNLRRDPKKNPMSVAPMSR